MIKSTADPSIRFIVFQALKIYFVLKKAFRLRLHFELFSQGIQSNGSSSLDS